MNAFIITHSHTYTQSDASYLLPIAFFAAVSMACDHVNDDHSNYLYGGSANKKNLFCTNTSVTITQPNKRIDT